ncbi:hypothetical protein ACHAXT_009491 [Thalassiosira profunda]
MAGEPRPRRSPTRPKRYEHEEDGPEVAEGENGAGSAGQNKRGAKRGKGEEESKSGTSPATGERRSRRSPALPKRYERQDDGPAAEGGGKGAAKKSPKTVAKGPRKRGAKNNIAVKEEEAKKSPRIRIRLGKRKAPPSDDEEESDNGDSREVKFKATVGGRAVQKKLGRALLESGENEAQDVSDEEMGEEDEEESAEEEEESEEEVMEVKVRVSLGGKPLQKRCCKALVSPPEESGEETEEEEESEEEESEEEESEEEEREVKVRASVGGKPVLKRFCTAIISLEEEDAPTAIKHPGKRCKADGCLKYKEARSDGYCRQHFVELGDGTVTEGAPAGRQCVAEGCVKWKAARSEGYCKSCFENGGEKVEEAEESEEKSKGVEEAEVAEEGDAEEDGEGIKVRLRIAKNLTKHGPFLAILPEGLMERVRGKEKKSDAAKPTAEEVAARKAMKKAMKKDPNAPKRPPSAFFLFVASKRPGIKAQHPEMGTTEVVKACSEQWKQLDESAQAPFREEEKALRAKYNTELDEYKERRKEMGLPEMFDERELLPDVGASDAGEEKKEDYDEGAPPPAKRAKTDGGEKTLYACPDCNKTNLTARGIASHYGMIHGGRVDLARCIVVREGRTDGDAKPAPVERPAERPAELPAELPADWEAMLDFEILPAGSSQLRKSNGATKCRAVDCPKNCQGASAGFCRVHHNRYLMSTGQCGHWDCKCGDRIADFMARCGKCHRWRGGVHGAKKKPSALDEDGDSVQMAPARNHPKTHVPPDLAHLISEVPLTNSKGRPLCKVIGCGKMDQSGNDGFCRMHFNQFSVPSDGEDEAGEPWTCPCGNVLGGRNKRCGVCNRWREGKHPVFKSGASALDGISADNIIYTDENGKILDDWTCECGNVVPGNIARCSSCHHWRGGQRVAASRAVKNATVVDTRPPWECLNCRTENPESRRKCLGCRAYRKKSSFRSSSGVNDSSGLEFGGIAGWNCGQCDFHNPTMELSCFMCQTKRPNWEWHQRQQLISAGNAATGAAAAQYPVQADATALASTQPAIAAAVDAALASEQPDVAAGVDAALAATGEEAVSDAMDLDPTMPSLALDATASTLQSTGNSDGSYYGRPPPEGASFAYISLYYDFNQSYYENCRYPYLNGGVNAGSVNEGGGGKEDASSNGEQSETVAGEQNQSEEDMSDE